MERLRDRRHVKCRSRRLEIAMSSIRSPFLRIDCEINGFFKQSPRLSILR